MLGAVALIIAQKQRNLCVSSRWVLGWRLAVLSFLGPPVCKTSFYKKLEEGVIQSLGLALKVPRLEKTWTNTSRGGCPTASRIRTRSV